MTDKSGAKVKDEILIYLYTYEYTPSAGDIVLSEASKFDFDTTSEQTASKSMAEFRAAYPDFAVVKSVKICMYGTLPHIEITAR